MPKVALILAAGMGTRMRSKLAKVLHPLLGRPMVSYPVQASRQAGLEPWVVVHHQEDAVRAALTDARFVRQLAPRGTGDAVAVALPALPSQGTVVVLAGDAPLVRPETLTHLLEAHGDRAVTVLTARVADPTGYGRLVRDAQGAPLRIVEHAEASPEQRAIDEINTGAYAFDLAWLAGALGQLRPHAHKDEIYLTDVLELAAGQGRAGALLHDDAAELLGVNDRWSLATARRTLQRRILRAHAVAGVSFEDPERTVVEPSVQLAQDVLVGPGVVLRGDTRIEEGATVGPYCVLDDTRVGAGAQVLSHSVCEGAVVGRGCRVGPFARLRPAAVLEEGSRVGNFVEVKKSTIGQGAKASHLSYIGDAHVGARANIGAGTITCNYDGYNKHHTEIGEGAFIGSNTALVAPVQVGEGAIVGAGSVITSEVPADAVAVARGRQANKEGAASRFRKRLAREKKA